MRKLLTALTLLLFLCLGAMAQTRTITGVIRDVHGAPVPYATIAEEGTTNATTANEYGTFTITVQQNSRLTVSSTGYLSQTITPSGNTLNLSLARGQGQLEEVVVTAVGISRAQRTLGYSASTLNSEELLKARETNVLNSLAGKVSGVRVNAQSGTLGGSAKVTIRGVNTLSSTSGGVLYVVDGTPINNTSPAGGTTANNVDFGNRAGDINADDIETISVLKGGAATALYGARARDGAIIITTKKGRKTGGSVTVNSSVRFDNVLKLPEFQNEFAQGNYGVYDLKYTNGWGPRISAVQDQKFKDFKGDSVTLQAYPSNVKDYFQTGVSYLNNVAFSGAGDNSDYRLSFTSMNETGVIPQSKLDRYTISLNSSRQFNDKLSSRFSASYTSVNAVGRPAQSSNNQNVITSSIYGLPRVVDINKLRENYIDPVTGQQIFLSTDKTGNNPFWIMEYNKNNNKVDRFVGTFNLNFKPFSWLTISDNLGGDIYAEGRSSVTRKGSAGSINGSFTNSDHLFKQFNNDFIITAGKDNIFEDFGVRLIAGHNVNEREAKVTTVDAADLTIDQLYTYSNAASKTPNLAYSKRRIIGVYGDLGFSYRNLAYLNVTARNDWTSTLPIENRSYFYPSVSGSFIFSELMKDLRWLTYGKLRGSWASVGGDVEPYALDFLYTPTNTVFLQFIGANTTVFPFSPINTAFTGPRILPNQKLRPQRQNTYEFGTDLKFLNSRIGLSFTFYNTVTRDQIISIDVPISTGYFANRMNVGSVGNKGIEIDLNLQPVRLKDFSWNIDVNFGKNRQVVNDIAPLKEYSLAGGYSGLQIKAAPGQAFGLYGTGWLKDSAGNFVINANTGLRQTIANQRFGDIFPEWTMGINNSFNIKGFIVSGLVDIRKGGVFYSGTVSSLRTSGLAIETAQNRDRIFIEPGVVLVNNKYEINTIPVQSMQDFWAWNAQTTNTVGNVFDASFVKLRELRIAYALPSRVLGTSFVKGAEFGIEGRNLWIIKSSVPHVDPELNFFGPGSLGEGVEFNSVPSARSIGANVRLSF